MGLWPVIAQPAPLMISTFSRAGHGVPLAGAAAPAPASTVLGVANFGIFWPIQIDDPVRITKAFVMNGATINGNFDIGIYDLGLSRIASTGSVAQSGANALQEVDIADFTLDPGAYHLAFCASSATAAYFFGLSAFMVQVGAHYMASAFPLPATLTRSGTISGVVVCGFSQRSLVA